MAALERQIVIAARDLGKLKTWAQAVAVGVGGFAAAGAWGSDAAWWALLVAVVLTWLSALDYARVTPRNAPRRAPVGLPRGLLVLSDGTGCDALGQPGEAPATPVRVVLSRNQGDVRRSQRTSDRSPGRLVRFGQQSSISRSVDANRNFDTK